MKLSHVAIGVGAAVVAYVGFKHFYPSSTEPKKPQTVGGGLDSVVSGVRNIIGAMSAKSPIATTPVTKNPGDALPDNSPYAPTPMVAGAEPNVTTDDTSYSSRAMNNAVPGSPYAYEGLATEA